MIATLANLTFVENVDEDSSRVPLTIHATGTEADLRRLASLLNLAHGRIQSPEIAREDSDIVLPTDIVGLTGDHQWNHGRTAIPQGTPLS
jgi:hypothetical protein